MPVQLERELMAKCRKLHPDWSQDKRDAYVYSTMREMGMMKASKESRYKKGKGKDWDNYRKKK